MSPSETSITLGCKTNAAYSKKHNLARSSQNPGLPSVIVLTEKYGWTGASCTACTPHLVRSIRILLPITKPRTHTPNPSIHNYVPPCSKPLRNTQTPAMYPVPILVVLATFSQPTHQATKQSHYAREIL